MELTLFVIGCLLLIEFCRWLLRCEHQTSEVWHTYKGDGRYEYSLRKYDFCIKCGAEKASII